MGGLRFFATNKSKASRFKIFSPLFCDHYLSLVNATSVLLETQGINKAENSVNNYFTRQKKTLDLSTSFYIPPKN